MKNLHQSLKTANQQVSRLKAKIEKMIENQAVHLQDNDTSDVSNLVSELDPLVDFLGYLSAWEREVEAMPVLTKKEKQQMMLSRETREGLRITGTCS